MRIYLSIAALFLGSLSTQSFAGANEAANIAAAARRAHALVTRVVQAARGGGVQGGGQIGGGIRPGGGFNPGGGINGGGIRPGGGFNPGGVIRPGGGFNPGGGFRPGGGVFPWQREDDAIALPLFQEAQGAFDEAGNLALESQFAFVNFQIQLGNFKFVTACQRLAIAKNLTARANLAALRPPAGFLGAFGPDVMLMLQQIEDTRRDNGC